MNVNQLGVKLLERHDIETQITMLNERIMGANNPQNLEAYNAQLHEKRAELSTLKEQIKVGRQMQLAELNEQLKEVQLRLEITFGVHDIEELGYIERELKRKIEQLEITIDNENK